MQHMVFTLHLRRLAANTIRVKHIEARLFGYIKKEKYILFVFINPLTLELNPSAQRCLTKIFIGDFAS
jgi:hypothetical protein